jgi:hypothetical protein
MSNASQDYVVLGVMTGAMLCSLSVVPIAAACLQQKRSFIHKLAGWSILLWLKAITWLFIGEKADRLLDVETCHVHRVFALAFAFFHSNLSRQKEQYGYQERPCVRIEICMYGCNETTMNCNPSESQFWNTM